MTTKEEQARKNGKRLKLSIAWGQIRKGSGNVVRELLSTYGYTWEKEDGQWVLYSSDHAVVGVGQEAAKNALQQIEATVVKERS